MFSMASSDAFRTLIFASLERRRSMDTTPLLSSRPVNHNLAQLNLAHKLLSTATATNVLLALFHFPDKVFSGDGSGTGCYGLNVLPVTQLTMSKH